MKTEEILFNLESTYERIKKVTDKIDFVCADLKPVIDYFYKYLSKKQVEERAKAKESSEWIKELGKNAIDNLKDAKEGDLSNGFDPFIHLNYIAGDSDHIILKGFFTTQQLQSLLNHMNQHNKE
jgi:hypothetical protein